MGIYGTLLFKQKTGYPMLAFGILSGVEGIFSDASSNEELRYVGINEFAPKDTCSKGQMGSLWPFMEDYEGECALNQAKFKYDGHAFFKDRNSPAQLIDNEGDYGESILDRSISIYGTESKDALNIDACCKIEEIEKAEFRKLTREYKIQKRDIK